MPALLDAFRLRGESTAEKAVMLAVSTFVMLTTTGSVYGWSPILLILQELGVYSELCTGDDTPQPGDGDITTCEAQDLRLNLIYTAAVMSLGLTTLGWGIMVDWLGPRVILPLSSVFFGAGCLLFAFSRPQGFDAYAIGFVGIAAGGCGMFYGLVRLSELFGKRRVTVLGIYSVAFDASTVVFPLYGLVYKATGFSLQSFFIAYSSISIIVLLCAVMWPLALSTPQETIKEVEDEEGVLEAKQRSDEALPLLGLSGEGDIGVAQLHTVPMSERPFKEQIASLDYWVFVGYIAVSVLWLNMYIGTMPIQLERITSDRATVDFYVEVFSWLLPAVFIVGPLIGWGVDKAGIVGSVVSVHVCALAFSGLKIVPSLELQFATFVVLSVYRALFYTAMIALLIEMFGYGNFGKLWGFCIFFAGCMNYAQQPFLVIAYELGSFYYIDLAQLASMLLLTFYPLFLYHRLPRLT
ncbi:uncharacterized protein ACA1_290640 [Acanthamoeba castellanii str. Neff]|uniref:Transporter, major facilitator subfamily protein n=1 Tax=Acanthamoeba castellanii (strain ATCC 30010 / Neff) TaxID=1257118 RepID=L8HKT7_ACACF|nr:uncharacterized protein ACA1_290640 [Acanthamoeba castellanii str. Neff]ELR25288.1 hypothetical protein ACA1_290640 [Acanthamoeba castellanii str. Neff]